MNHFARVAHRRPWGLTWAAVLLLAGFLPCGFAPGQDTASGESSAASPAAFEFVQELALPAESSAAYFDFLLPVSVFDGARVDLGDLRLYDAEGQEVPYALRVRNPERTSVASEASEFNRTHAADGTAELTLDLGDAGYEHNEVEIHTLGDNFRRRAALEGSNDAREWRPLAKKNLVKFSLPSGRIDDDRLTYPPSRYRYLRVRVSPDPEVDDGPITIEKASARRQIDVPGEEVTFTATLGPREPVRASYGAPGSAWTIDLGGRNVPCENLLVEISDREFNREYEVASLSAEEGFAGPLWHPARSMGTWQRVATDPAEPMRAELGIVFAAARLRLTITDHANPPLHVTGAKFTAAARQVIFARTDSLRGPLKLYYGNAAALPPEYDFARNLPREIDPAPQRLSLATRQPNPAYVPPPKPLTERWPWLIYVVLGSVSVVLALLLSGLARAAVARHDTQAAPPSAVSS